MLIPVVESFVPAEIWDLSSGPVKAVVWSSGPWCLTLVCVVCVCQLAGPGGEWRGGVHRHSRGGDGDACYDP